VQASHADEAERSMHGRLQGRAELAAPRVLYCSEVRKKKRGEVDMGLHVANPKRCSAALIRADAYHYDLRYKCSFIVRSYLPKYIMLQISVTIVLRSLSGPFHPAGQTSGLPRTQAAARQAD